jgi:hypothetical protein
VDFKRLLGGLSALAVVAGLLVFSLTHGGPLNRVDHPFWTGDYLFDRFGLSATQPGPSVGLILLGVGTAGLLLILCWRRRPGQPPLTLKRVLTVYALYVLVLGTLFLCLGNGGPLNPWGDLYPTYRLRLDMPWPVVGWICLGIGAVVLVVVWSLKPAPGGLRRLGGEIPVALYTPTRPEPGPVDLPRPPDFGIAARDPLKPPRD